MTPLEGALFMAGRGLRVFRLKPGSKDPFSRGIHEATTNEDTIRQWWKENPALNVGVSTTGLVGLDVDVKHGPGWKTDLASFGPLPKTLTVTTATGGFHYYFRGIEAGQRKAAPHVDVRGRGGYLVGPGSVVGGKRYELTSRAPVAEVPSNLLPFLSQPGERAEASGCAVVEQDTPAALWTAQTIAERAPAAPQGGRNDALHKLACQMKDRGASEGTTLELLLEHWCPRCDPPYDDEQEIERTVASAFANGRERPGSQAVEAEFENVAAELRALLKRPARSLFPDASRWIGRTPEPAPFVCERIIPRGFVTLLVSAGGRGKTLLAQTLMTCVAAGSPFLGFRVEQGAALGLFCEDDDAELHRRQVAICEAVGVALEDVAADLSPVSRVGTDSILWLEKTGPTELLKQLEQEAEDRPGLKLLVLDNVSQLFAAPEQDRGQVTRFVNALNGLATRHQLAVLLIAHESKTSATNDTHAASGSTAWINASRSVLKLDRDKDEPALRTLVHVKSNRGPLASPVSLRFEGGVLVHRGNDAQRDRECTEIINREVLAAIRQGENLSPKPRASNHAAKVLFERVRHQGFSFSFAEIQNALGRLEGFTIVHEQYSDKGKTRVRYRAAGEADAGFVDTTEELPPVRRRFEFPPVPAGSPPVVRGPAEARISGLSPVSAGS